MRSKYFVSLSFADDGGRIRSIVLKTSKMRITAPIIRQALDELDMTENASLLSATWLGRMSDAEYTAVKPAGARRWLMPYLAVFTLGIFVSVGVTLLLM